MNIQIIFLFNVQFPERRLWLVVCFRLSFGLFENAPLCTAQVPDAITYFRFHQIILQLFYKKHQWSNKFMTKQVSKQVSK